MKKILTLFFPLLGMLSCAEEYDFQPYEPEKTVASELTLLEYDFLADGEKALADFSGMDNTGKWHCESRGLAFDGTSDAALYLDMARRITFEERVTRVRLSLFSDTRFGMHWLGRDGKGGSLFTVDAAEGTLNIHRFGNEEEVEASVYFTVENGHVYVLEAVKSFRSNTFTITDEATGETASVSVSSETGSTSGGNTVEQNEFKGGRQNNVFGLRRLSGKSPFIKSVEIAATVAPEPLMYIAGDSVTEGDFVSETARFGHVMASWLNGRVVYSGQSGSTIDGLMDRLSNELPVIRPKFVMLTTGTDGGNTRDKLVALVDLVRSYGAVPILNRIPLKDDGSSAEVNEVIASVCEEKDVASCRFDLATASGDDSSSQDRELFTEDLIHPNEDGHYAMAKRLFDIPGILLYAK